MSEVFHTGRFRFADGAELERLSIAYWTMGKLNAARDNALLLCHGASGNKQWARPYCRPGGAFDPQRWFLISVDVPGGGESSRHSRDPGFPPSYSLADSALSIAALLDGLGILRLRAFCGPSMASLIGLELAYRRRQLLGSLVLWCGGFRCNGFGRAVAEMLREILQLPASPRREHAAVAALLPALVSRDMLDALSDEDRSALIGRMADEWRANWRADELIARYGAIARCDLGARAGGEQTLAAGIGCPVLWLQATTDALFPAHDLEQLTAHMADSQVRLLDTPLGHLASAAAPGTPEFQFFDQHTARCLDTGFG